MKYHLVTPFSRPENFDQLRDLLRPFDVEWHLLLDEPRSFELKYDEPWIHECHFPKPEGAPWQIWRRHINRFCETQTIIDEDRYGILADDCAYEPDFFDKITAHPGDVVIASMKRGDNTPGTGERAHGTSTLVAAPENMHPCQVSAEQAIMCGRLFRRINLALLPASDGYMIEALVNDHGAEYAPEAFVWFNWLEDGRWNKP